LFAYLPPFSLHKCSSSRALHAAPPTVLPPRQVYPPKVGLHFTSLTNLSIHLLQMLYQLCLSSYLYCSPRSTRSPPLSCITQLLSSSPLSCR
jgi:hypothetical protein